MSVCSAYAIVVIWFSMQLQYYKDITQYGKKTLQLKQKIESF
jgi:hypothetical protein